MACASDETDSPEFVFSCFLMRQPLNSIRSSVSIINAFLFLKEGITKSNENFSYRTFEFCSFPAGFHTSPEGMCTAQSNKGNAKATHPRPE